MADPTKRDDYTRDRFRWWDTLAADPEMSPGTFIVGYAIATALKRNSGNKALVSASNDPDDVVCEAWIGADAIAEKIGMSTGTVFANVQKLVKHGYIQIDPGKPGSGHSHHYRLVEKGQPADLSKGQSKRKKGQRADYSKRPKDQPADHLSAEKVSGLTNKGQPADMNPFVPSEEPFEQEPLKGGAPPARPAAGASIDSIDGAESLNSRATTIDDGDDGIGVGLRPPPPNHLYIDEVGNPMPPPPDQRRPPQRARSNVERGREMLKGIYQ